MNDHPARPVRNLSDAHRLGKCGLDAIFKPGSKWHYFKESNPVVTVGVRGAHTSGVNRSVQPEDALANGEPSWFIRCTNGQSYPPHTLIPHDVVVAQRNCAEPEPAPESLRRDLEEAREANRVLHSDLVTIRNSLRRHVEASKLWQDRAVAAEDKLRAVRVALRD